MTRSFSLILMVIMNHVKTSCARYNPKEDDKVRIILYFKVTLGYDDDDYFSRDVFFFNFLSSFK